MIKLPELQAVNTVKNNDGILEGYNTDVNGFLLGLNKLKEINVKKPALIIGAGGACIAILYGLKKSEYGIYT